MTFGISLILGIVFGAILSGYLLTLCSLRLLGILQQGNYSERAFLKWYCEKRGVQKRRISLLSLSLAVLVALFNVCFCFLGHAAANLISIVPFAAIYLLYCISENKYALKVKTKATPRLIRLAVFQFLLLTAVSCGLGFGMAAASMAVDREWFYLLRFVPYVLLPLGLPLFTAFSSLAMKAYEIPHSRGFIRRAKKVLENSPCIKVGITGSFGKTSVKRFAAAVLAEKYSVIASPASFNTPIGIARTVNQSGADCDVFLAEMGARKTGDIAELCDMISPDYGIVTGVCPQHCETFGSIENIAKEKGVLARRAKKGCVLGATASAYPEAFACEAPCLQEGVDFAAEDVELTADGVSFQLRIGDERARVQTCVLGRHAAEDIAIAAATGHMLGMTMEEIVRGIAKIQPVPHRLQKIEANGLHILDDSYNSNVEGAKNAVETLSLFEGKKYVVTPGIVELGDIEEESNRALGASLVGLDGVILVGETLVLAVRRGYLEAGGEEEKLCVASTLDKAQQILAERLSEGDAVLFLNDLPDIYR